MNVCRYYLNKELEIGYAEGATSLHLSQFSHYQQQLSLDNAKSFHRESIQHRIINNRSRFCSTRARYIPFYISPDFRTWFRVQMVEIFFIYSVGQKYQF